MKTPWLAGLSEEKKEEIRKEFASSVTIRKRLAEICDKKLSTNERERVTKEAYASPNWAYLQADAVGYERALREIISLLS